MKRLYWNDRSNSTSAVLGIRLMQNNARKDHILRENNTKIYHTFSRDCEMASMYRKGEDPCEGNMFYITHIKTIIFLPVPARYKKPNWFSPYGLLMNNLTELTKVGFSKRWNFLSLVFSFSSGFDISLSVDRQFGKLKKVLGLKWPPLAKINESISYSYFSQNFPLLFNPLERYTRAP